MSKKFYDFIKAKKDSLTIKLSLIGYEDSGMQVLYSAALELYGYGDDEKEALNSFNETLQLYIEHVIEEDSLELDLIKLGWTKYKTFNSRFKPPTYDPRNIMQDKDVNSYKIQELEMQPAI